MVSSSCTAVPPAAAGEVALAARRALKLRVFQRCDKDADGILNKQEMYDLACMVGFEGTDTEWEEEYARLCQERSAEPSVGIPVDTIMAILDDDSDTGCFCTDDELELLCTTLPQDAVTPAAEQEQQALPARAFAHTEGPDATLPQELHRQEPPAAAPTPTEAEQRAKTSSVAIPARQVAPESSEPHRELEDTDLADTQVVPPTQGVPPTAPEPALALRPEADAPPEPAALPAEESPALKPEKQETTAPLRPEADVTPDPGAAVALDPESSRESPEAASPASGTGSADDDACAALGGPGAGAGAEAAGQAAPDPEAPATPPTAGVAEASATPAAETGPTKRSRHSAEAGTGPGRAEEDDDPIRSADFSRWLDSVDLPADTVEFQCSGGAVVHAHAFILAARSEHFRTLFAGVKGRCIPVPDASRAALLVALRFLYSGGTVHVPQELVVESFALAKRFGLDGLQMQCLKHLYHSISAENALSLFVLSEQHEPAASELKERCVDVIRENLEHVCSSEPFKDFCSKPEHVRSLFLAACCDEPARKRRRSDLKA